VNFQQDNNNDPKHTSHAAQKWFKDNGVEVLVWPAQSPELNPIEHLWQHLKQRLATYYYETGPISMHELWKCVEAEWNKIPPQICIDLITRMPRRVAAVLKAK
ncbi:6666_t:CDS:1, partial [Paraglomus occultum]